MSQQLIDTALKLAKISAFGISMPVLSPSWTDSGMPSAVGDNAANLSLSLASGTWKAPLAGTLLKAKDGEKIGVTLVRANDSFATGPGLLLTLFQQPYLRLIRLYAQLLETSASTDSKRQPVRPVPRYFFFAGAVDDADRSGNVNPGDNLDQSGEMTIYDNDGMPIDPLAVAAAFTEFMQKHKVMSGEDFDPNSQVKKIADLAGTTKEVRLRLSDHAGAHYEGAHLKGIEEKHKPSGIFKLKASSGSGSDLTGSVTKEDKTGTSGSFPDEEHRLLMIGPATTGRLGDQFSPPSLPSGVTLARDFFSLRVVALKSYLLGNPNTGFAPAAAERRPAIRIHEPINILADGNDVLAAANQALASTAQESLCVAQAISGDFDVPSATGEEAHWLKFPPLPTGPPADSAGSLPLRIKFEPAAAYVDDGKPETANVDVALTLNNLPKGAAVRVYPRKFVEDAREARGDGAGDTVSASGKLTFLLKDPFALRRPSIPDNETSIPTEPTLRFDVMIVKRTGEARLYGNVEVTVKDAMPAPALMTGNNPFNKSSVKRGVSNAGILGLGKHTLPSVEGLPLDEATLRIVRALTGEGNPRDASRLPTMARRDLLVAGLTSGKWRGVIAGGRLTPETHSADARRGAPGGRGGRETQVVGVSTQNGRLAYDIARMGFRRATYFVERLIALKDGKWDEPAQPDALPANTAPNENSGAFAGAVLQTIAPFCETPELALLKPVINEHLNDIPKSFNALVDWIAARAGEIGNNTDLTQIVSALKNLKSNSPLDRLFDETHRELLASCFGRRDTQWALAGAIAKARRFIYIESPGFAPTQKDYGTTPVPAYAVDLIGLIATRLSQASGLHVIICTPKYPDYGPGYEAMAVREATDRRARLLGLDSARVVAFHPVGFPGRSSRLESMVVIIDDLWALVGSSTFRRRGLTFDGGSDLVFTDTDLVNGQSPAISKFRRQLMADRLGVPTSEKNEFGTMPNPTYVRLRDGIEAFYAIREQLVADGLGKIDRLWNGRTPGVTPVPPETEDKANPEGMEYNLFDLLLITAIAELNAF